MNNLTTTVAPSAEKTLAMPAPIPFDAPVMMATLPANMFMNFNLAVVNEVRSADLYFWGQLFPILFQYFGGYPYLRVRPP